MTNNKTTKKVSYLFDGSSIGVFAKKHNRYEMGSDWPANDYDWTVLTNEGQDSQKSLPMTAEQASELKRILASFGL